MTNVLSLTQQMNNNATNQLPSSDQGSNFAEGSRYRGPGRIIGGRARSSYDQNMATNWATDYSKPFQAQTSQSTTYNTQ